MAYPQDKGQTNKVHNTGEIIYGGDGTNFYPIYVNSAGNQVKKTVQTELFAAASVAASSQVASTILDLTSIKKATVFIDHGRSASAAFGTNGTEYKIQVSMAATATNQWRTLASVSAASAVCMTAAASSNVAVGATTVVILSGTAVVAGDIMVWPSGTIEWFTVKVPTGTASFTTADAVDFAHAAASAAIIGGGEHFAVSLDVAAATRLRVFINNLASGTTQTVYSRVACITEG